MKVLIVDAGANGLDFAVRTQDDGHDVYWCVPDVAKNKQVGEGIVRRVSDFKSFLRWADLVFLTDNTKWLDEIHAGVRDDTAVIGPTKKAAAWELDREVGMEVLKQAGVPTPPYECFTDYDEAIAFVKKTRKRYVSKVSGDADKSLSYCSKTPADMVYMLERWKKANKLKGDFILQEFIEGTEMAVGGWIGKGGFNEGWCENWEFKKLCNDDLGCATGEQGTVMRYVRSSKLASKVLAPLEDRLLDLGYVGYIDVNTIITDEGDVWPLEFTMRPGWPTFNIQQELHQGDCVSWLKDLWDGIDSRNFQVGPIAIGVVMSVPDYPYSHLTKKDVAGVPVYGITDEFRPHVHPCEMMRTRAPDPETLKPVMMPATAGDYVLVMSATGETVKQAQATAYRRLKTLIVPNSPMYRTDIGDRLRKQLPKLQSHGFAKGMEF